MFRNRRAIGTLSVAALAGAVLSVPISSSALGQATSLPGTGCPARVNSVDFSSADRIHALARRIADFGLRLPGSTEHNRMLDWLGGELRTVPGLQVRNQNFKLTSWEPTTRSDVLPGGDMGKAGELTLLQSGGNKTIKTAGAMAFTEPALANDAVGRVVYLPASEPITEANSRGKIVLRDVPSAPIPYAALVAFSHFLTPDLLPLVAGNYDRPYVTTGSVTDIQAAHKAGAVGFIEAFNVPTRQVRGYFDPHDGTLQHIPGVWVGVDEREALKRIAANRGRVRLNVRARITENTPTRNIIATLPGQTSKKIVLMTNTDGNTWVQENSGAALLAVADYFARLPIACRPATLEFAFTSAHLAYAYDGAALYQQTIADDPDISFVFVVEHLGTREILPVPRTDGGPGQELAFTGKAEPYAWFAPTESPALSTALTAVVATRNQSRSAVLRGLDAPAAGRFPTSCQFGGLANFFHGNFIPSIGGISGPWSLWAPAFGEKAIDFERMRSQALVVGDTVLALDDAPKVAIQGLYTVEKQAVASGLAKGCPLTLPPAVAPQ